ncbi:unnamed protein product, partial [Symbiodinium necroappetens]
ADETQLAPKGDATARSQGKGDQHQTKGKGKGKAKGKSKDMGKGGNATREEGPPAQAQHRRSADSQ